jgi:GGDEF domain-containing protein
MRANCSRRIAPSKGERRQAVTGMSSGALPDRHDGRRSTVLAGYEVVAIARSHGTAHTARRMLFCDPLTGLVAYPSFEDHLTRELPALSRVGLHLAIGDVDDLKRFVSQQRLDDPAMFGHLAGNACMQAVGDATLRWAELELPDWPFSVCATFGGDEVIVAAAGRPYAEFIRAVARLRDLLAESTPRTCSFAVASTGVISELSEPRAAYRRLVSQVDHALFASKDEVRSRGEDPTGELVDTGVAEMRRQFDRPDDVNRM